MNTGNAYSHNKCYTWSHRVPSVKHFFLSQPSLASFSPCGSTYTAVPQCASGCIRPPQVSATELAIQESHDLRNAVVILSAGS